MINGTTMRRATLVAVMVFACLFSAYAVTISTSTSNRNSGEGFIRIAMLENFLRTGEIPIGGADYQWGPTGRGGMKYSWHEFGQNIFVLPIYLFLRAEIYPFNFVNMAATGLTAVLIMHTLIFFGFSLRASAFTGLSYGLGTFAWVYASKLPHEHALGVFFIMAVFYYGIRYGAGMGRKNLVYAALALGTGFITRYDVLISALPLAVHLWRGRREYREQKWHPLLAALVVAGILVPFFASNAYYSYIRFDDIWETGRSWQTTDVQTFGLKYIPMGFLGAFLSPGKSIFLFAPVILLALFYARSFLRRIGREPSLTILIVVAAYSLFYTANFSWDGEWGFGPRYFLPLVPFMTMPLSVMFERWGTTGFRKKALVVAFLIAVFVIQVAFVTTVTELSNIMKFGFSQHPSSEATMHLVRPHARQGTWSFLLTYYKIGESQFLNQLKIFYYTAMYHSGAFSIDDLAKTMYDAGLLQMLYVLDEFKTFDLWWLQQRTTCGYVTAALLFLTSAATLFVTVRFSKNRFKDKPE